jgi:hypothetical protein
MIEPPRRRRRREIKKERLSSEKKRRAFDFFSTNLCVCGVSAVKKNLIRIDIIFKPEKAND